MRGCPSFEVSGQVVVFQQHAVFHRLMPALNLNLGLRMVRRTANVIHTLTVEVICQIGRHIGRAVVAEQPRLVYDRSPKPPAPGPACR